MEGQKVKNVIGVVNNPIGVIGLFLVLVEAIAALVVVNSSLPYSLNLILPKIYFSAADRRKNNSRSLYSILEWQTYFSWIFGYQSLL